MAMNQSCRSLLTAAAVFAAACTGLGSTAGTSPAAAATVSNWIVSSHAIGLIDGYTGSTMLTTNAFDVPSTAEIGRPANGWVSKRTATYTFYGPVSKSSSFLYALKHGTVPKGTVYVMLDMESWALTPHSQQVSPKVYLREFVTAARQHGYQAILAPSIDLTKGMACSKTSDPAWKNYLANCSVPTIVAQAKPDVYEIQSQRYEANTSAASSCGCFAWFVGQAAAQAQTVVASLDVRAGLSTNPGGHVSTGQTLYTDTLHTSGSVDGYWLNVPEQGTTCPNCVSGGAPQVAVSYLTLLGYAALPGQLPAGLRPASQRSR
jgi:hypothetical protein